MKYGKVENGKLVAIVNDSRSDDVRVDEQGRRLWRPVDIQIPEIDDTREMLGDTVFQVQSDKIIETREVIALTDAQKRMKTYVRFYTDPDLPTVMDRLDALEAGDAAQIDANKKKVQEIRTKHGL